MVVPLPPLWAFVTCYRVTFTFTVQYLATQNNTSKNDNKVLIYTINSDLSDLFRQNL